MLPIQLKPNIYWVGVNDHDTALFEGLWPISDKGVSYNSYVIDDDKKALIDLSDVITTDVFLKQLQGIIDISQLDYIVMNHLEPDHSGTLQVLHQLAPNAEIYCTKRAKDMLQAFFNITDNIHIIEDNETLNLGKYTLRFLSTPNVHWPETMMTYVDETQMLFTCDGFGGFGALKGRLFADEYSAEELADYKTEALRYYVNIIATFSRAVLKAIDKLADLPIQMVAPSHGLLWRENPQEIIDWYKQWSEYGLNYGESGVTLIYASMYGSTKRMMDAVAQGIAQEQVPLSIFNISETHSSYIMPSIWTKRGVMVGAPTYEGSLFPPMTHVLDILSVKHIRGKVAGRFGSYGWKSAGTQKKFEDLVNPMKWEIVSKYEFNGGPTDMDPAGRRALRE